MPLLLAAHPRLLTPVLRIIHSVITGFVLKQAGPMRATADTGAVTLIQRFGSVTNLNIHLHGLVLDGAYRNTEGEPVFQAARAPSCEKLVGLPNKSIARLLKMLTRRRFFRQPDPQGNNGSAPGLRIPPGPRSHAGVSVRRSEAIRVDSGGNSSSRAGSLRHRPHD